MNVSLSSSLYRPLGAPREIRLIKLQPGQPFSPIESELVYTQLDTAPVYEALSYVWGNPAVQTNIQCNTRPFAVTENLGDALERLRMRDRSRLLWIDAICINQEDLSERAGQVQFMRDIYAKSERVLIWLGRDDEGDTRPALQLMTAIKAACDRASRQQGEPLADFTAQQLAKAVPLSEFTSSSQTEDITPWRALVKLFARPWFSRVWCVQEVIVARNRVVMCGDCDLSWDTVGVTAVWVEAHAVVMDFRMPSFLDGISIDGAQAMYQGVSEDMSLLDALSNFRDFRATDLRDKIYAILGLVKHDRMLSKIIITYDAPAAHVFTQIVIAAIETFQNLWVLSFVQHPPTIGPDMELPSFTPNWDHSIHIGKLLTSDDDFMGWNAGGHEKLEWFAFESSGVLRLRGLKCDTVAFVSARLFADVDAPVPRVHPVWQLWKDKIGPWSSDIKVCSRIVSFAMTLTCEIDYDYQCVPALDAELRESFLNDYMAYLAHLRELAGDEAPDTEPPDDCLRGDSRRFEIAASRMCDERRLFLTGKGDMGLGPQAMCEGDIVVVLYGARTPFVLRPVDDHFLVVGEAFVEDIMRGEALSDASEQTDEMEFELR